MFSKTENSQQAAIWKVSKKISFQNTFLYKYVYFETNFLIFKKFVII